MSGYDEGGVLTEAVRRRPYQVILFDEVEKAHEDVFNILLQVLDDGRLTDGQGRTVDFRNTIIVLTSNLGSDILAAQAEGEDVRMAEAGVMARVREHFRPEFLNRLDEIVLFRRLQRADMATIVTIQLQHLEALLADRNIRYHAGPVGAGLAGGSRIRPGLWRAAAEAGDPAQPAKSAGRADSGRRGEGRARPCR